MRKITLLLALFLVSITQAQIVTINDANFKQALLDHYPVIDSNSDNEIQVSEAEAMTRIYVPGKNITDLGGIAFFVNLEELYVQRNALTSLDLSQNLALKKLYASTNLIETINVSNNINLEEFNCSENLLVELDLSLNINLLILQSSGNLFVDLDVSNNTNLVSLICTNSPLVNINGLENLTLLKSLNCSSNEIETLDLSNCPALETVNCGSNKFTSLDLSNNENLIRLICGNNSELKNLNVKNGNNFAMQQYSSGYDYYLDLPQLEFVCSDGYQNYDNLVISDANSAYTINFTDSCYTTSSPYNSISGITTYNQDNSCSNLNDGVPFLKIVSTNGVNSYTTFSLTDGNYYLRTNDGSYTTTIENLSNYYTANPASGSSVFTDFGNTEVVDFCLETNQNINDLNILVVPLTESRPGFEATYRIIYSNEGTTILNGDLSMSFDNSKLTFLTATETVASQTANELTFNFSNLSPFETRIIDVNFNIATPPTAINGQVVEFLVTINPITGDNTTTDNTFLLHETLVGSYDPNDIRVLEGSEVLYEDRENYLHYIIRFQNTGTASAINIVVENVLEEKLDLESFQLLNTSHSCRVAIDNGNDIDFIFEDINLLDSTTDETNSHGFIVYKVKPKSTVALQDIILNKADIFFDFNEPIITNTASTQFVNTLSVQDFNAILFTIHPNPVNNNLNIESKTPIKKIEIYNSLGQQVLTQLKRNTVNVSTFNAGIYFIKIIGTNEAFEIKKFIKL
jgi:Leucine-rich repeat (LRR) protein